MKVYISTLYAYGIRRSWLGLGPRRLHTQLVGICIDGRYRAYDKSFRYNPGDKFNHGVMYRMLPGDHSSQHWTSHSEIVSVIAEMFKDDASEKTTIVTFGDPVEDGIIASLLYEAGITKPINLDGIAQRVRDAAMLLPVQAYTSEADFSLYYPSTKDRSDPILRERMFCSHPDLQPHIEDYSSLNEIISKTAKLQVIDEYVDLVVGETMDKLLAPKGDAGQKPDNEFDVYESTDHAKRMQRFSEEMKIGIARSIFKEPNDTGE